MPISFRDRPHRDSRLLSWLGHYNLHLLAVAVVSTIISDSLGQPGGAVGVILTIPWFGAILGLLTEMSHHRDHLCERCVAATPLDTQAAVERWRWALKWAHMHKTRMWGFVVILIASGITDFIPHENWQLHALNTTLLAAIVISSAISAKHHRLYPWCPWCHWGGGGDHEISPDVPAPTASV